ncbi:PilT/PilU family type 4a pilus ATPase [Ideonella oryzae]|uniref:PilT/PilU family type 4a pilus ATPase n=1 Tax=Ideonella oryzae TaxID=2937441 RepID=A0ABT1BUC2_9BURK|nr:PilT/PilU family type 4a pilus ATPase [Ideonella oryzae]MCO5979136.1 PilT/PilU family type 4a pilus ATPase [Ideonella oryzae]
MNMQRVLQLMAEKGASDLYLSANAPALLKINGQLMPITDHVLAPSMPRTLLAEVLTTEQLEELDQTGELNIGIGIPKVGSFRLSGFKQRNSIAAVVRCVPVKIPSIDTLNLPPILAPLSLEKRGLILMVGATGTGKSTTMAAMLEWRNQNVSGHILTIEDPIEFLFNNKRSIVNQREVGRDTASMHIALKNALRQAPDCIMIGEIRDRETMSQTISYALSGHLVLATLHANNSYHALGRILSFYTPEARPALLADLSAALKAIVSQRLLRSMKGGRIPAVEVMQNSKLVSEMIEKGDFAGVKEAMERSLAEGSQTFEQELAKMIKDGLVSRDEALAQADSPTNLLWRLQNEQAPVSRVTPAPAEPDSPSFTEITLDVVPETAAPAPLVSARTR